MNASSRGRRKKRGISSGDGRRARRMLPAMLVAGGACGLAPVQSPAVELGELQLNSALGQPLRASIAYALNPNEQLYDFCIFLKPGFTADGIPYISRANISIADGRILLTGSMVIREPMLTLQLSVDCPYTAHLTRNYMVMMEPALPDTVVDPGAIGATHTVTTEVSTPVATVEAAPVAAASPTPAESADATPVEASKPAPVAPAESGPADTSPILQDSRYLTQVGDTLSGIVSRIEDRPVGLWEGVDAVFFANPEAFDNNDKNLLRAGSWLVIPDLNTFDAAAATVDAGPVDEGGLVDDTAYMEEIEAAYSGHAEDDPAEVPADADPGLYETSAADENPVADEDFSEPADPATATAAAEEVPAVAETSVDTSSEEIQPGDLIFDEDSSFVTPVDTSADEVFAEKPVETIAQTPLATESRPVPVVATSPAGSPAASGSSLWSWLFWIVGGALVVIPALIVFGRRLRNRVSPAPAGQAKAAEPLREEPQMAEQPSVVSDVDFEFDDDTLSSQQISLDADLEAGTGLQDNADMDVAQDFGFSATGELEESGVDMEIPEEEAREPEQPTTQIIPPHLEGEPSIVDSEIPPDDRVDDSQYDLSMIVDVTKHTLGAEDVTSKDLNAVQIGDEPLEEIPEDQTLRREVDIQMLEQDYQEEYTQTQALNEEIAQAALELAETMARADQAGDAAASDSGVTAEMSPAAEAGNEDIGDLEDTGINEELTIEEQLTSELPTAEMPMTGSEPTNEMPKPGSEPTVEMEIESGKVGGKKSGA